jgi:hypothetical protein
MPRLKRWLREPLLHFAIGGALLFWLYDRVAEPHAASDRIVVSAELVSALRADHQRRTGKPPSAAEEQALIDRHVEQELLYREALALGLDRGDIIVRRRLVQKMEMILEAAPAPREPSDVDLQTYLDTHAARYAQPQRLSLTHVFASTQRWGADAKAHAAQLRADLLAGADPTQLGDPFVHGGRLNGRAPAELASLFGPDFAGALAPLPLGIWSEPLPSAYGQHVVRIDSRTAGSVPALGEVRGRVREDWLQAQREAAREAGLQRLRARYTVIGGDSTQNP